MSHFDALSVTPIQNEMIFRTFLKMPSNTSGIAAGKVSLSINIVLVNVRNATEEGFACVRVFRPLQSYSRINCEWNGVDVLTSESSCCKKLSTSST